MYKAYALFWHTVRPTVLSPVHAFYAEGFEVYQIFLITFVQLQGDEEDEDEAARLAGLRALAQMGKLKIALVTGDLEKNVFKKNANKEAFDVVTLGNTYAHSCLSVTCVWLSGWGIVSDEVIWVGLWGELQ